jgi:hypothetical protein
MAQDDRRWEPSRDTGLTLTDRTGPAKDVGPVPGLDPAAETALKLIDQRGGA